MANPSDGAVSPYELKAIARREARARLIAAGDEFPTRSDRCAGLPPYKDSPRADLRSIANRELDGKSHTDDVIAALTHLEANPTRWAAQEAVKALGDDFEHYDAVFDLDWCSALLGDVNAQGRTVVHCLQSGHGSFDRAQRIAFGIGLSRISRASDGEELSYNAGGVADIFDSGVTQVKSFVEGFAAYVAAVEAHAAGDTGKPAQSAEDAAIADLVALALEDRAETALSGGSLLDRFKNAAGEIVVPALPATGTGWRKEIYKSWAGIAGVPLPLVTRGDVAGHMAALVAKWPHAASVIETILSDLSAREPIRIRPTLLVGKPGSGKSALARAIGEQLGLPVELTSLAGAADSSLMGTSAQWSSARESTPLQLIKRTRIANPLLVWDEVEKASPDRRNGSALDGLLGMLEFDQASHYRDPALEVECNLGWLSHIATANDVDLVPAPLRDRMRILTVPEPGWEHLGTLVKTIVSDIARQRDMDPRWIAPLAEDEIDLVKQAWPGGSIRQLTRIVTVLVDGRDSQIGRA